MTTTSSKTFDWTIFAAMLLLAARACFGSLQFVCYWFGISVIVAWTMGRLPEYFNWILVSDSFPWMVWGGAVGGMLGVVIGIGFASYRKRSLV